MFSALAEGHGNIHEKINVFIAMAPIVYMENTNDSFLKDVSNYASFLQSTFDTLHVYELFGDEWRATSDLVCTAFSSVCDEDAVTNVKITPYINEYQARVSNVRKKSGVSVK